MRMFQGYGRRGYAVTQAIQPAQADLGSDTALAEPIAPPPQAPKAWKRGTPEWETLEARFWRDARKIVNAIPQPEDPKGVLFLLTQGGMKYTALTVHMAATLKSEGWAVIYVDTPNLNNDPTGIPAIDQFQSCFQIVAKNVWALNNNSSATIMHDWHIDWPNKRVECEGVNYYCPFEERLGKIFRCYSVPVEKPGPKRYLDLYLANADKALTIVTEMYERVSKTGLPVRIIGAEPGYVPTGIFATFAREIGCDKDFDFISMSEGYANYMRAGRAGAVNSVTIARVSRPGDRRIPRLPDRTMFEDWMASRDFTDAQVGAVVKKAVGQRRGNQSGDSIGMLVCDRLRKRLAEHRAAGGTVICMFGKVLYDRSLWEDEGFIHEDMKAWVNDTIHNLTNEKVLLLVRPHPSEGVKEYFGTPNEYFVDLIEKPSKQTIYLDPSLVELSDFIDQLDAGLMWFGTAGIELAACGVPVVYCSKWTETDYVLPALNKPSSKEEYHRWINDPASLRLSKEDREECAKYLVHISEGGPAVPFDLAELSEKVMLGGPARWNAHAFDPDDPSAHRVRHYLADVVTADANQVSPGTHEALRDAIPGLPAWVEVDPGRKTFQEKKSRKSRATKKTKGAKDKSKKKAGGKAGKRKAAKAAGASKAVKRIFGRLSSSIDWRAGWRAAEVRSRFWGREPASCQT